MMSHDVIKFNFHTMSLPILLAIGSCPEKLQVKFESVSSYGWFYFIFQSVLFLYGFQWRMAKSCHAPYKSIQNNLISKIYIKSLVRSWPLKLFTVVLGATTNVQKNYQVLGVQKLFGHMTMQPLYRRWEREIEAKIASVLSTELLDLSEEATASDASW